MNIYDRQHNKSMGDCAKRVEEIIAAYEKKIMGIITRSGINPDDGFKFSDHPALKQECDKLIKELSNNIRITIEKAEKTEWERSNDKNDKLVSEVVKSASAAKNMGYMQRNLDAMEAFIGRKIAGMNLSQRVWNITKQFRGQMEAAVDIALQDHKTADELSRDVRQYLRYPDKLFRRVRDEKGVLHLSKAAKAFHPGRGVYRSSYMNARRLAATEINMAYRTSDDTRRQQLDFVVGIEVHLSNNHNCNGIPEGEFRDICDKLQGKYPKTFKFVGWHPHCRCYATSILKTREEVMEDIERRKKGLKPVKSVNEVKDVPDGFKEWVDQNQERIANANSLPYFLSDNGQMVDGQWVMNETAPEPSLLDNAQQRHSMRTPEQIKDIKERWKKRNEVIKGYETTKKRAGNILNMEKEWSEVSFEQLRKAMDAVSDKSVYRASDYAELKKMLQDTIQKIKQQQTAEKVLSDVIPDVHKWHKQFSLAELGDVKDSIEKFKVQKASKNYVSAFNQLPLAKQKQLLENESKYVSDPTYFKPHTLHKTWEVAKSAYEKELSMVENAIAWEPVEYKLANIKAYSIANPKSSKIANLVAEAEKLKSSGGTIAEVEAKILEAEKIKAKNEASVLSHAKAAAAKKIKELDNLVKMKSNLEQKKQDVESEILAGKSLGKSDFVKQKQAELKLLEKDLKDIEKKIVKLGGGNSFGQDDYSDARKNAAFYEKMGRRQRVDDEFREETEKVWATMTKGEKQALTAYTEGSGHMNRPLRGYEGSWSNFKGVGKVDLNYEGGKQHIIDATNAISRSRAKEDLWVVRGWDTKNGASEFLGMKIDRILAMSQDELNRNFLGKVLTDEAFMSCGSMKGSGFSGYLMGNIYCPKGTQLIYAEPFSRFNGDSLNSYNNLWDGVSKYSLRNEFETIIQRGTKYRVSKIYVERGRVYADFEVVGQISVP